MQLLPCTTISGRNTPHPRASWHPVSRQLRRVIEPGRYREIETGEFLPSTRFCYANARHRGIETIERKLDKG